MPKKKKDDVAVGDELKTIWGGKKTDRLNKLKDAGYFGKMTVRELAAVVICDKDSFPNGLDTKICIGDVEGNFCTNILGIGLGGTRSDHVCIMGDLHGGMQ